MCEYEHKEAFCLMNYKCEECKHHEVIWNSRDGVTPFGTSCPSCGRSLTHVYFRSDKCVPDHQLNKYQKFWRDGTESEAIQILYKRCKDFREQGYDMGDRTDEGFIKDVIDEGHEFQKGWPFLDTYMGDTYIEYAEPNNSVAAIRELIPIVYPGYEPDEKSFIKADKFLNEEIVASIIKKNLKPYE